MALLALFLLVFGAKTLLIHWYGSPMPFWDQWDAEAATLYLPYVHHSLDLSALLAHHNEHRIFTTRLVALALFELGGGWDPLLEQIVGALLAAGVVTWVTAAIGRSLDGARFVGLALFTAFAFMLPIGWENTLAGFQMQFPLVQIFSFASIGLIVASPAFAWRWWAGLGCGLLAALSLASGALAFLPSAAVVLLQLFVGARSGRKEWLSVAVLVAIALALVAAVPHIAGHDVFRAESPFAFVGALLTISSFPLPMVLGTVVVNAPIILLLWRAIRAPAEQPASGWLMLGLMAWVGLQMVSISYGRAESVTASRYLDSILISLPLNFAALIADRRGTLPALAPTWVAVVVVALAYQSFAVGLPGAIERGREGLMQVANVTRYLASGDIADLQNKPSLEVPYPDPQRLAGWLSDPTVRAMLPESLRPADASPDDLRGELVLGGALSRPTAALRGFLLAVPWFTVLLGLGAMVVAGVNVRRSRALPAP